MARLKIFVALWLAAIICPAEARDEYTYAGSSLREDGMVEESWLSFVNDGSEYEVFYGHVGLPGRTCGTGWACIPLASFSFAVPTDCSVFMKRSWEYDDMTIRLKRTPPANAGEERLLVFEAGKRGMKNEAIIYVGQERGVVGFSFITENEAKSYFLKAGRGLPMGDCIRDIDRLDE